LGKVCVIIGEDDFLVNEAAGKVVGEGVGLEVIDSNISNNEDSQLKDIKMARESYLTAPFFDPSKVTWWKNVRFLPGTRAKGGEGEARTSEPVKEALLEFAKLVAKGGLPQNQSFILSGPKLLMTSVFAKTICQVAEAIVFEKPKGFGAAREATTARVCDRAKELGLVFDREAAERFISVVGEDTRSLYSELDKMRCYKGNDSKVSSSDVSAISSPGAGVDPVIWQVTDALGMRDLGRCLEAVKKFEGDAGFAVMMANTVERFLRQLVEMKDAEVRGKFDEAASGMAPWAARKLQNSLRFWSLNELRVARMRFLDLRERVVSGGDSSGDGVVIELARICRKAAVRR